MSMTAVDHPVDTAPAEKVVTVIGVLLDVATTTMIVDVIALLLELVVPSMITHLLVVDLRIPTDVTIPRIHMQMADRHMIEDHEIILLLESAEAMVRIIHPVTKQVSHFSLSCLPLLTQ